IINKGYAGLGYNNLFYEYDPLTNIWTAKASYPSSSVLYPVSFSIGNFGYVCTGGNNSDSLWQYNPALDVWTSKDSLTGVGRSDATGFAIGIKGYLGTGYDGSFLN